jgi:hypothetical protein
MASGYSNPGSAVATKTLDVAWMGRPSSSFAEGRKVNLLLWFPTLATKKRRKDGAPKHGWYLFAEAIGNADMD